jgi:hypothetical protein
VQAVDDVAEHDILYGEFDSPHVQYFLSRGLQYIHILSRAETYEARIKLLGASWPKCNWGFFYVDLERANQISNEVFGLHMGKQNREEFSLLHPPYVEDQDAGPSDAWHWAYEHESRTTFAFAHSLSLLHERAYCMWDFARLDGWPLFQEPWKPCERFPFAYHEETAKAESRRAEIRESRKRRLEIYLQGGRGWWSADDESKVIWPPGKGPGR